MTGYDVDWMLQECAVAQRFGLPLNLSDRLLYAQMAVPLAQEVRRLRRDNDDLHDDLIRMMNERREIALAVCAEFMPGPDGQDDIDRATVVDRIIADGFDHGRDAVDSYRDQVGKLAVRLARAEIERDALAAQLGNPT